MNFEHFFDNKKQNRYNHRHFQYSNSRYQTDSEYAHDPYFRQKAFLQKVVSNRKLRVLILIGLVVVTGILVALVALLFPLLKNLVNYVLENGISGLMGEAGKLLEKIWSGSK